MAVQVTGDGATMTYEKLHKLLSHPSPRATKQTAVALGIKLTDKIYSKNLCSSCTVGKAQRKDIPRESEHVESEVIGERKFIDISSVKNPKNKTIQINSKRHWCLVVEKAVGFKTSTFHEQKSGMVPEVAKSLQQEKDVGRATKYLRMDNAGEKYKANRAC